MKQIITAAAALTITTGSMYPSQSIIDLHTNYNNTAVILVMGQSNIANHGAAITPYNYTANSSVMNFYAGQLKTAQSPAYNEWSPTDLTQGHLATGDDSTFLPELGDMIVSGTTYDSVVFVNIAFGGSSSEQWVPDYGPVSRIDAIDNYTYDTGLFERVQYAKQVSEMIGKEYTHILWCQGESDNVNNVSTAQYKTNFLALKDGIRSLGINAPIYMSRTSYLDVNVEPTAGYDINIINAQNELIAENADIYQGPDTDSLDQATYRYDFAHFNTAGLQALANMWFTSLTQ